MQVSTVSDFFLFNDCENSNNWFPQPLSTLPKTFYPVAQPKKSEGGFLMLTGLTEEAVESSSGYARS